MKVKYFLILLILILVTGACTSSHSDQKQHPSVDPAGFVGIKGTHLVSPEGEDLLLRGVAFGNSVWSNPSDSSNFRHHQMSDYANIKSMGFNAVRFYVNYGLFEDDSRPYEYKDSGFDWLKMNIEAARQAGIYLILNMHFPQGGFQSIGEGDALWQDGENQKRLAALWKEIAFRFRTEPRIIGYGLVNEPIPVNGMSAWTELAQNLINAIREVDRNHLIFVERAIWMKNGTTDKDRNNHLFPVTVHDPQNRLVWEFHMYEPMAFTHQNASWTSFKGQFSRYPDEDRIEASNTRWAGMSGGNPIVPSGSFDWQFFEGKPFKVENSDWLTASPVVQTRYLGENGTIMAADISIDQYDENGTFVSTLKTIPLDSLTGWGLWSKDNSGSMVLEQKNGRNGNACIAVTGIMNDGNITNYTNAFIPKQGWFYKISGWLKGQNLSKKAKVSLRIDFNSAEKVHRWNKEFLSSYLDDYVAFAEKMKAPVYLGEFGVDYYCFENDRGGLRWVGDMLDLLSEKGINYNYHTYHEFAFGIYTNSQGYPDPAQGNGPLIELFREKQQQ